MEQTQALTTEEEQANKALGSASIPKLMLRFSVPCVLSLLVSALYNIVDQIFIGNSNLGDTGNGAAGIVFPLFIIAQAFAWWFGDGCAAYLNICQGKKDTQNAHKAIGNGILITVVASLILMLIFYPLKKQILMLFGATEDGFNLITGEFERGTLDYATEYFNIILAFFPAFMAMNMMNAVVRADGSPAWSMASMLSGAIINIILDAVFILALGWGMSGAAWATVIGQVASFAISLFYFIFKTKTFRLKLKSFIPDFKTFANPVKLGMSSFITQMTIVIISLVCNIMLGKYGYESVYGANIPIVLIGIESKVFTVVINIVVGIVLGCQPIIGYNIGAKKYDRVKKTYLYILLCTLIVGVVSTVLFEAAPRAVVGIFGEPKNYDPERYWQFATKLFRIFLMLVTFTCTIKMTSIFFQAAGKPVLAIIASMIRDIVCFIPLICTLPLIFDPGIEGILWAAPAADLIAMIVAVALTLVYFKNLTKDKSAPAAETEATVIKPSVPGVIIAIGREHGSGGKQIGKTVAEKLNIPFYYKEMCALAAKESGLDKEFISGINKNAPNVMHDLYLSTAVVQQAVVAQDKIIKKIAENGSCVIVGRAADYVLRDNANLVKVFVHAPREYREKRVCEVYGDTPEQAKKNVVRSDKARALYYKNITGQEWGDARNYDLCVNGEVGVEKSAQLICDYVADKN